MSDYAEKIRKLAYEIWELAGRPEGRDQEFWFAAEAKLAETEPPESETGKGAVVSDFTSSESKAGEALESAGSFQKVA